MRLLLTQSHQDLSESDVMKVHHPIEKIHATLALVEAMIAISSRREAVAVTFLVKGALEQMGESTTEVVST